MKKNYMKLMGILFTLFALAGFTSCDCFNDETDQAMALSGEWRGDFGMYYVWEEYGQLYTFDSYDTEIVFYPAYDFAHYGWGRQIDHYNAGPYTYQYFEFKWELRGGNIYLTYPYDHDYDTVISDYRMTNDFFTGYFVNGTTPFKLHKVTDYYDWTPYVNYNHSYGYNVGWNSGFYSNKRVNENAADSVATGKPAGKIVGHGSRFAKTAAEK